MITYYENSVFVVSSYNIFILWLNLEKIKMRLLYWIDWFDIMAHTVVPMEALYHLLVLTDTVWKLNKVVFGLFVVCRGNHWVTGWSTGKIRWWYILISSIGAVEKCLFRCPKAPSYAYRRFVNIFFSLLIWLCTLFLSNIYLQLVAVSEWSTLCWYYRF